ncbi:hypothetical protein GFM14_36230 [Rhizobium leguminosarum bv. viciae]|uniref:hypothetical protein n=1 Tax=Rhizobium TaxID=379 RepID=UPI00103073B2|nr:MULTISPECIES: hypothetical protein [Rhizobium]NKJ96893.1 hypothetical protein [Rhizobium leguminosarum bv. viciae]TAU77924.1 hypothetical protein ELI46_18525 [Rhizobium ruizarguesonis]
MQDAREKRVPFMMSEKELTSVDDWRFKNRISTRADALRRLCKLGMALDILMPDLEAALARLTHAAGNVLAEEADGNPQKNKKFPQTDIAIAAITLAKTVGLMNQKAKIARTNPSDADLDRLDEQNDKAMKAFDRLEEILRLRSQED